MSTAAAEIVKGVFLQDQTLFRSNAMWTATGSTRSPAGPPAW